MNIISRDLFEQALFRCHNAHPPVDYRVCDEMKVFATIWAHMNCRKEEALDLDGLSSSERELVLRWLDAEAAARCRRFGAVDNAGNCEACQ